MVSIPASFFVWSNMTRLLKTGMNGKTVEIVVNREGYAELTYNKRFWKDASGRHHPTRGISGDPAECAYLLAWMLENPEAVTRWAEFAKIGRAHV